MYTVRFFVKPHLAAYMYHRYSQSIVAGAIHLPATGILYNKLYALTARQPLSGSSKEEGNLVVALPCPAEGKSPTVFNYLSAKSIEALEAAIDLQMHIELYEYVQFNKFKKGVMYQLSVYRFQRDHEMWDITEDALKKSYQRWRDKEKRGRKGRN